MRGAAPGEPELGQKRLARTLLVREVAQREGRRRVPASRRR